MPEVIDLTDLGDSDSDEETYSQRSVTPLDDLQNSQLQIAIATTPELRLREILAAAVLKDPEIGLALFKELVAPRGRNLFDEFSDDGIERTRPDDEQPHPQPQNLVTRWQVCLNCNDDYDASTPRVMGECVYHPGDLEVNEEEFVDHDERCHGPMDTKANRRDFPENFTWNCCQNNGRADGCEEDRHQPGGSKKKRARYA